MNKISIIIPYFGVWPQWINLFIHSCERNKDIDFYIFTDCNKKFSESSNIKLQYITFSDYCKHVSDRLKIDFQPNNPYLLCDLKPFLGIVHKDILADYDFWGFGDIDVVWGDIRSFYSEELLNKFDIFSTHNDRISGHLCLIRNTDKYINLCLEIKNWPAKLCSQEYCRLDETEFTKCIFRQAIIIQKLYTKVLMNILGWRIAWEIYYSIFPILHVLLRTRQKKLYFKEQHSTPILSPDGILYRLESDTWYYIDGKIKNNRTELEYIYLHFMVFKKNNIRQEYYWTGDFYQVKNEDFEKGIIINKKGISVIS